MATALTVNEAAALLELDEKRVRKELEYGFFGPATPPRLDLPALVYFRVVRQLGVQLGVEDRRKLCRLIADAFAHNAVPSKVQLSLVLEVRLDQVTEEISQRLRRFEGWKSRLVVDQKVLGGEPVFPGRRLAVRHVGGMLLRGTPIEEVREDYPYLTDQDIEYAKLFTAAYPRVGRPRTGETAAGC